MPDQITVMSGTTSAEKYAAASHGFPTAPGGTQRPRLASSRNRFPADSHPNVQVNSATPPRTSQMYHWGQLGSCLPKNVSANMTDRSPGKPNMTPQSFATVSFSMGVGKPGIESPPCP